MGTVSIDTLHEDLEALQKDVQFIKHLLAEDFELSEEAKAELKAARGTPRDEYVSQEEMEREFSQ